MKNLIDIIKISKPLHKLVVIIALLILFSAMLALVVPILSKFIVDEIVLKVSGKGGDVNRLIILIVITFGISLLGLITSTISDRIGDHFAISIRKIHCSIPP